MVSKDTLHGAERGVSPVVGVILMVAITVILAAVIAAFTMGIADFSENPQAAVDVSEDTDEQTVTVQVVSNDNADYVYAEYDNRTFDVAGTTVDNADSYDSSNLGEPSAGDSVTIDLNADGATSGSIDGDEVTVIGEIDGNTAVLETYTIQSGS